MENLVSVVTPVFNGEAYIEECIHSVLQQTYGNFEYIIADNVSTDATVEMARRAAGGDARVRIVEYDEHLGPIQNWNRTLEQISDESAYVKFVHADDWLFDECLEQMVSIADSDDRIGLVSAYRLEEDRVSLDHHPRSVKADPGHRTYTMNGREVARAVLIEKASVLGSPTALLMRRSAMHSLDQFYTSDFLHADKYAALKMLENYDFAFVRQVLTYTRRHNESVTSLTNALDTRRQENLRLLEEFGSRLLTESEFRLTWNRELRDYYGFLGQKVLTGQGRDFWESHQQTFTAVGAELKATRIWSAFARRWMNPGRAWRQFRSERQKAKRRDGDRLSGFLDTSRGAGTNTK